MYSVSSEMPATTYAPGEEPATDPYVQENGEFSSDKPVYSTETDEVTKLRTEMAAMKKEMQELKVAQQPLSAPRFPSSLTVSTPPAPGSLHPAPSAAAITPTVKHNPLRHATSTPATPVSMQTSPDLTTLDPDVIAVLHELGVNPHNLQAEMGATSQAEAVAMANAHKASGTLEVSDTQGEFNTLSALYQKAMTTEDKNVWTQGKSACAAFIEKYSDHSLSRSALFFFANILLKSGEIKEAQNAFARVYRGDEQGPHGADSLLGMAEIFLKQGNKAAAIKFIEKVKKDFKPDYLSAETKAHLSLLAKNCGLVETKNTPNSLPQKTTAKVMQKPQSKHPQTKEIPSKTLPSTPSSKNTA